MADEPIGSVSVNITGDYSGLEKSFQDSQNLAQQAGQGIATALESGATGATALTSAVSTLGSVVDDLAVRSGLAGGELNLFRAALQGSLDAGVPVSQALTEIAASSGTLGTSVATAAESLSRETAAATQAASANAQLDGSFKVVSTSVESTDEAFKKFADDIQNFISHPLQSAGEAAKDFLLTLGPMGLVAGGVAAGIAIVSTEIFNLVKASGQAAEATGNMADRLNLSWHETRNLEEMAQIAGVSITGLQQASFRMAEALDGTSANGRKVAAALAEIGVTGNTSGELLNNFLTKLAAIPDDTQRIALAHEVLGRSSQQILPLIKNYDQLQAAIRELGPAIGDQLAGELQKSDDAFDKLEISWARLRDSLAATAAPAVGALVDNLRILVVESSKLIQTTIDSGKSLAEMIPDGLTAKLWDIVKPIIDFVSWSSPFVAGARAAKLALDEFNLAVGVLTGSSARDMKINLELMDYTLRDKLTTSLHNATTGTKEFAAIWANAGGGVAGAIDSVVSSQQKLSDNVRFAKGAYDQLNEAFKTGTPLANGHKVTVDEVARALSNMKAAEAAAALTKQDSTDKTKLLTAAHLGYKDAIAVLVAMEGQETSAHKAVIDATAKWNEATGQTLTAQQYLAKNVQEASRSIEAQNGEVRDIFGVYQGFVDGPLVDLLAHAKLVAPLMDEVAQSITEAKQAALDSDPYAQLSKALEDLGIKGQNYYRHLADDAEANYQIVLNSGVATYEELARAALISAEAQIRAELEVGDISRDEADKTLAQIKGDLDKLDTASAGSAQNRGRHERTLGEDIQNINRRTFDSLEKGLANSIVNLKGWGDLWKTLWQGFAKDALDIMFKVLLNPLEKALGTLLSKIPGLGIPAPGGGGGGGGGSIPGVPNVGGAAGAAGQVASAGVGGIINIVSGAVSAISSVIGNFQMAGMNKSLDLIENYTRYLKIGLVEQPDSLLNDQHVIRNTLTDFMKWNWGVATTYFQGISEKLDTIIGMGGVHPIAAQAVAKMTVDAAAAVPSDLKTGGDVIVNIDTVSPDVTDTKVRDTMNRAVRMSKLAGAFPPNRFPS